VGGEARRSFLLSTISVLESTRERMSASNDGYVVASNRQILTSELANLMSSDQRRNRMRVSVSSGARTCVCVCGLHLSLASATPSRSTSSSE
jgi:hypothetical protein